MTGCMSASRSTDGVSRRGIMWRTRTRCGMRRSRCGRALLAHERDAVRPPRCPRAHRKKSCLTCVDCDRMPATNCEMPITSHSANTGQHWIAAKVGRSVGTVACTNSRLCAASVASVVASASPPAAALRARSPTRMPKAYASRTCTAGRPADAEPGGLFAWHRGATSAPGSVQRCAPGRVPVPRPRLRPAPHPPPPPLPVSRSLRIGTGAMPEAQRRSWPRPHRQSPGRPVAMRRRSRRTPRRRQHCCATIGTARAGSAGPSRCGRGRRRSTQPGSAVAPRRTAGARRNGAPRWPCSWPARPPTARPAP